MPATFVQQTEVSTAAAPGSVTTGAITTTAGNLLVMVIGYNDTQTPAVASSQSDVFTVTSATADYAAGHIKTALYYTAAGAIGGSTTFTLTVGGTGFGIYVAEYSSAGLFLSGTPVGNFQNSPGSGTDTITSGSVASTGAVLLFGFSTNGQLRTAPTAGTSPIAFNSRTPVWATWQGGTGTTATPEDADITGAGAATFGPSSGRQFDIYLTVAAAFSTSAPGASIAWVT